MPQTPRLPQERRRPPWVRRGRLPNGVLGVREDLFNPCQEER